MVFVNFTVFVMVESLFSLRVGSIEMSYNFRYQKDCFLLVAVTFAFFTPNQDGKRFFVFLPLEFSA